MLFIALLHYPVYNKNQEIVTTSIANMDIHDLARVARTYDIKGFYIIHPISEQRDLAREIIHHWREGYGANHNKHRQKAFELIGLEETLTDVIADISDKTGKRPHIVATGANLSGNVLTFDDFRKLLENSTMPYLLLFGTGSGLTEEVVDKADYKLEPLKGRGDYNHLSVRSAAAIMIDRIWSNEY